MKKIIGLVVLAASMSTSAMALQPAGLHGGDKLPNVGNHGFNGAFPAPEIDPASALTAMTMLGTGLVILRGRISKK